VLKPLAGELCLPIHYHYCLQSFIYHMLPNEMSQYVHDNGFIAGNKRFRMFTFSDILEEGERLPASDQPSLLFTQTISFLISTAIPELGDSLVEGLENALQSSNYTFNRQAIAVTKYSLLPEPDFSALNTLSQGVKIKMLSPLTVYETHEKQVTYHEPATEPFDRCLRTNALEKMKVIEGVSFQHLTLILEPSDQAPRKAIIMYKSENNPITSWKGHFLLKGSPELLKITYQAGLGAKNSQGFGMWKVV